MASLGVVSRASRVHGLATTTAVGPSTPRTPQTCRRALAGPPCHHRHHREPSAASKLACTPSVLGDARRPGRHSKGRATRQVVASGPGWKVVESAEDAADDAETPMAEATTPTQTFSFPDGSSYQGQVKDGRLCGDGEWRSALGDSYIGSFVDDVFEGRGCYTDSDGNVFTGQFKAGAFEGVGTYLHSDGRGEVGQYVAGKDSGDGARWSADRAQAWRLRDGEVVGEITLEEAAGIAQSLGLSVPESVYSISADGLARLRSQIAEIKEKDALKWFEVHAAGFDLSGERIGPLIAHSTAPLVDAAACEAVVAECEARAAKLGGWTTERHENYPTTDVPLQKLPRSLAWFRESFLPDVAFPFLARAFGYALPAPEVSAAFTVIDSFVVKYDAAAGQRLLKPHRDGCVFSFNLALNDWDLYEGGGTYFRTLEGGAFEEGAIRSPKGHLLAHSSALMHGGHPITSGVRYILVAFVTVEPQYLPWAYQFYEHVKESADGD